LVTSAASIVRHACDWIISRPSKRRKEEEKKRRRGTQTPRICILRVPPCCSGLDDTGVSGSCLRTIFSLQIWLSQYDASCPMLVNNSSYNVIFPTGKNREAGIRIAREMAGKAMVGGEERERERERAGSIFYRRYGGMRLLAVFFI